MAHCINAVLHQFLGVWALRLLPLRVHQASIGMGALAQLQLRQQPLLHVPLASIGMAQLVLPQQLQLLHAITTMYVTLEKVLVHVRAIAKAPQLPLVLLGKLGMAQLVPPQQTQPAVIVQVLLTKCLGIVCLITTQLVVQNIQMLQLKEIIQQLFAKLIRERPQLLQQPVHRANTGVELLV